MNTSCDCSFYIGDLDMPEFSSTSVRRARKLHSCCECGEAIAPGTRYEYVAGKWDGEMDTHATCLPCAAIREHYCPCGWIYGALREHLEECLGFDYTTCEDVDA